MKRFISVFTVSLLLFPCATFAQAEFDDHEGQQMIVVPPPTGLFLTYQGVLHDADGLPVPDDTHVMIFAIYDAAEGEEPIWSETQSVDVLNGVFTVLLGKETTMLLPFDRFYWLGVTVDRGEELLPRKLMTPVPYSYFARTVALNAITEDKISNGAVTESKIGEGAVITNKISDGAVTAEKLAENLTFSSYTRFQSLNTGSVTVTSDWTKLNIGTRSFSKEHDGTNIEVFLHSRAQPGIFQRDVTWIQYQLRVNGVVADHVVSHLLFESNVIGYITLKSIYESLPAGKHTVEVWARTSALSSSSVLVDPGNFEGAIIVKETF